MSVFIGNRFLCSSPSRTLMAERRSDKKEKSKITRSIQMARRVFSAWPSLFYMNVVEREPKKRLERIGNIFAMDEDGRN